MSRKEETGTEAGEQEGGKEQKERWRFSSGWQEETEAPRSLLGRVKTLPQSNR